MRLRFLPDLLPVTTLGVIREKCLDCCCCQAGEVDRCTAVGCSLWPYRFGTNPFSNRRGNPEAFSSCPAIWLRTGLPARH
jgi:hypothetical protein